MKRAEGFYWVREGDDWKVCQWLALAEGPFTESYGVWLFPGCEMSGDDSDLQEIGPKVERP